MTTADYFGFVSLFIQWKGTDVCMDFRCPCGVGGHFDGYFAYVVECPGCHKRWEMSWHVVARESVEGDWHHDSPKMLDASDFS